MPVAKTLSDVSTRPIDQAANSAKSALHATERATRQAIDTLSQGLDSLRDRAARAGDNAGEYIRAKPVNAMLISAAVGGALVAVAALLSRSRY